MIFKFSASTGSVTSRRCSRDTPVVRCLASVAEPKTYIPSRERAARYTSSGVTNSVPGQTRSLRRVQDGTNVDGQQQLQQQQATRKPMLPSLVMLEDDVASIAYKAKAMYPKCFADGNGVVIRSLGRQGAAGAFRYLLALREEGAAAADQRDVCVRLVAQEPIKYFGSPTMMIVTPVKGRTTLPAEGSPQCTVLSVSARTELERLETRLFRDLNNLQRDHFIRLDMVGTNALYRGLSALRGAQDKIPSASGTYFAVPELVSVPIRTSQPPQQQGQQQQLEGHEEEQQEEGHEAAAAAQQPLRVQVVRLYVGRSRGGPTPVVEPAAAHTDAGEARPIQAAVASNAPSSATQSASGKVLVSETELQELKGALGNMMEQQKLLAQLISQRQAAEGRPGEQQLTHQT